MDPAQNQPEHNHPAPQPDEDEYALSEPVEVTASPTMRPMGRVLLSDEPDEQAEAPSTKIAFFAGIFTFPFYPSTLPAWAMASLGLTITAEGIVFCFWLADRGFSTVAARCFGVPFMLIGMLSLSYTSACFVTVLEQTTVGRNKISDWPAGLWRDWFWTMSTTIGMLAPPAVILAVVGRLTGFDSWWVHSFIVLAAYPVLLLSALDNGSALAPISGRILRSLKTAWWCWVLLWGISIPAVFIWWLAVASAFFVRPFLIVLMAAPVAAAMLFIYARLLGRLCWYVGKHEDELDVDD